MTEHIDARIACELFRTVAPEDDFLLQIEHAYADLQLVEDVAVHFGILKSRHSDGNNAALFIGRKAANFRRVELGWNREFSA